MNKGPLHIISILVFILFLAACSNVPATPTAIPVREPTGTPTAVSIVTASPTEDPCSSGNVEAEVQKVHKHMREFDDAAILASNLPREELSDPIANLQRIRREAEDEQIPSCLLALKTYQVNHMNAVIDTLVAFLGGADTAGLEQNISVARKLHDDYTLELARLLGLTVIPATVPVISTVETSAP
jgi:hypothetical protein